MVINKTHYNTVFNLNNSYRACVPANAPMSKWPILIAPGVIRKTSTYTTKDNWKSLIQQGKNATTNRDVEIFDITEDQRFNLEFVGTNTPTGTLGNAIMSGLPLHFGVGVSPDQVHVDFNKSNADALASTQIYQRIREASVSLSGGVILGELAETLRMLKSPFESLRNGHRTYLANVEYKALKANVRGINQKSKTRVLNDIVANTWLEAQFGWKPFINDIKDIILTVQEMERRAVTTQVSSKYVSEYSGPTQASRNMMNDAYLQYFKTKISTYTTYGKVGLLPEISGLQTSFGLDSGYEFLPTIYELLPYSFVLDYFTNVGALIEAAATVKDRITYASISKVLETKEVLRVKHDGTYNPSLYKVRKNQASYSDGVYTWTHKTLSRRDTIPPLDLGFKMPNIRQKTNLAALFASSDRTSYKLRGL